MSIMIRKRNMIDARNSSSKSCLMGRSIGWSVGRSVGRSVDRVALFRANQQTITIILYNKMLLATCWFIENHVKRWGGIVCQ